VIVTLTNSFVPKQDFYVQVDEDGKPRNLLNEKKMKWNVTYAVNEER
jgi:hypothetical protein